MNYKGQNPKRNKYYSIASIIAIVLMIFHIHIYRLTIINPWVFVLIGGIVGFIISRIDLTRYKKTYSGNYQGFWAFIVNTVIWGSTSIFLFSFSNYYITNNTPEKHVLSIMEKGNIGGRHRVKPTAIVEIKENRKELVFSRNLRKQLSQSKKLSLYTEKGFWGFDVIKDIRLIKNVP